MQTRKRRRPTEPEEAVEDKHSERRKGVEIRRSNKNSDKEQRQRRCPCGEGGGLRADVGDEVPGAVGSRAPVQAVEAARVSSRPAQARDSVVHADEESTKTTSQTLFSMVLQPEDSVKHRRSARGRVEGVFAWCRACPAPLFPLLQLTARPNPSRIVAQNLIYLLHASLAVPGELLQSTKEL